MVQSQSFVEMVGWARAGDDRSVREGLIFEAG